MTMHCDLCCLTVRIMDDFLEEERIEQCFEGVSQWQKKGKSVPSRGMSMCRGTEDREDLCACTTRKYLVRLEGRAG